jgi:hypothetical protein
MPSLIEYRRRSIIPLTALGLAAYYLFVFMPLGKRARDLEVPLQRSWRSLASALGRTNSNSIDFLHITNQLNETREALSTLEVARKKAAARIELDSSVRDKINAPFQLVDYQNARSKLIDTVSRQAKAKGVALEPAVLAGFPEHTVDITQPELLWAALTMIESMLTTAMECKVAALHTLEAPLGLTNAPASNGNASLAELPLQLELTGPAVNIARFIQLLPLRGPEVQARGMSGPLTNKPPLFIERLVVKKQAPEKADEVRVSLRALGFVLRE